MSKHVEFGALKIFTLLTAILSAILPWCVIEIVYGYSTLSGLPSKRYISYFFFGLYTVVSSEPITLWDIIYILRGTHPEYEMVYYTEALPAGWNYDSFRTSFLLLIPGSIYIIGVVLSLVNVNVDGRYNHTKLHGLGFALIVIGIIGYFAVILRIIGGFLAANPHWINSGTLADVNVNMSIGLHTAYASAFLSLIELIISIQNNKKYLKQPEE